MCNQNLKIYNLVCNLVRNLAMLTVSLFLNLSCSHFADIKTVHPENNKNNLETKSAQTVNEPIKTPATLTNLELKKYAYEIGFDPNKELTNDDLESIDKRKKVRQLERTLDSQKERISYSKILPWLQNDVEKINYLSIPSIEGRQAWVNKNQIWKRAQNLKDYAEVVENLDIAAGMPADYVKKAWGEPNSIDHSGNPIYKNERWKYLKQVSTPHGYRQEKRYVYFEGGRVVGWETE